MHEKTSKKKRKTGVVEKEKEAKLNRDQRRMGALLAVESGMYDSMIPDYRTRDRREGDEQQQE